MQEATGHGSPLPHMTHGGPGRAGGGEELGGIRAVKHYMQRTSVQGGPEILGGICNQYFAGAPQSQSDVHPFRKTFNELVIGDTIKAGPRTISIEDIEHFAEFTGDTFYAHMDEEAASANPLMVTLTVKSRKLRNAEYGEVRWHVVLSNQDDEQVAIYELHTMNATSAASG